MSRYKVPNLQQRQDNAVAAKKATLEKFRATSGDHALAQRHAATRVAVNEARTVRVVERERAKKLRKAELAEQATRAAELVAQNQREAEKVEARTAAEKAEREALLAVEQKAARDVRYKARKAAKKVRRRGY
jgi:Family of unknown function (DUF6481)